MKPFNIFGEERKEETPRLTYILVGVCITAFVIIFIWIIKEKDKIL